MVNFCAVCACCTRTDIVREHLEDTLRICDVSAKECKGSMSQLFTSYKDKYTAKNDLQVVANCNIDENRTEQCCAAHHIVHSCQQC
jgi:hypothetical protein